MPVVTNISWYRGEDVGVKVTMTAPTNITGWTLQLAVKQYYTDTVALFTKSGAAITVLDAVNGIFQVAIDAADTASLSPRAYVYDVQRVDSGAHSVLAIGFLSLLPAVQS